MRKIFVDWKMKTKNGTFLNFQRPFFSPPATVWQYIWKRKANAYNTPLKQKYRCYFFLFFFYRQVQDPGMHYVAYFGSAVSDFTYHKIQYKMCFVFFTPPFFFFSFLRSPRRIAGQRLFAIRPQCTRCNLPPTGVHVFKSTRSGCILIHLEKTRHLVFSHMTWKTRDLFFPTCTQKIYTSHNLQKKTTKKIVIWKGPPWTNHIATHLFGRVYFLHGRCDGRCFRLTVRMQQLTPPTPKTESFEKEERKSSGPCRLHQTQKSSSHRHAEHKLNEKYKKKK